MDEFLLEHIPKTKSEPDSYIQERDTYGKHLQTTINRRIYLGSIDESSLLFIPRRTYRNYKELAIDVLPSVISLWLFGLSVLYTYPRCISLYRHIFPNSNSFVMIHIGIAPMMMFINSNLLGVFKGLTYIYFARMLGDPSVKNKVLDKDIKLS